MGWPRASERVAAHYDGHGCVSGVGASVAVCLRSAGRRGFMTRLVVQAVEHERHWGRFAIHIARTWP
jgi:hypothetical protein